MPGQVHQIRTVLPIVNRESRIESNLLGIVAQKPRANPMESTSPGQNIRHHSRAAVEDTFADSFDSARHFGRCTARECHQQDAARIGATNDQMSDPVGKSVGFSGSGTGDNKEWGGDCRLCVDDAMFDSAPLLDIKCFKIGSGGSHRSNHPKLSAQTITNSCFVRNRIPEGTDWLWWSKSEFRYEWKVEIPWTALNLEDAPKVAVGGVAWQLIGFCLNLCGGGSIGCATRPSDRTIFATAIECSAPFALLHSSFDVHWMRYPLDQTNQRDTDE